MTALLQLAQYRMDHDHMDGADRWPMALFMLLAVVAVILLVVWVIRSGVMTTSHHGSAQLPSDTPLQILDRRLAEGDISPEDYQARAAILRKT